MLFSGERGLAGPRLWRRDTGGVRPKRGAFLRTPSPTRVIVTYLVAGSRRRNVPKPDSGWCANSPPFSATRSAIPTGTRRLLLLLASGGFFTGTVVFPHANLRGAETFRRALEDHRISNRSSGLGAVAGTFCARRAKFRARLGRVIPARAVMAGAALIGFSARVCLAFARVPRGVWRRSGGY